MQSFGELMQEWLYGKEGYYRKMRVGKARDFYTSVSVSAFFGYCIGHFFSQKITQCQKVNPASKIAIVEIGAERGNLVADIAFYLEKQAIPKLNYRIIEPLEELHLIQAQTFKERLKEQNPSPSFEISSDFQSLKAYDIIFFVANELLDAFACELYFHNEMAYIKDSKLEFYPATPQVIDIAKDLNLTIGEIPLQAQSFAKSLSGCAKKWLFLTFDYGSIEPRGEFSLRFYRNHQTQNLFSNPTSKDCQNDFLNGFGKWDITYDVVFSLWDRIFSSQKAQCAFLHRQNRALVDMGLDKVGEWYINCFGIDNFMQESSKIRTLISPSLLGERFFGACWESLDFKGMLCKNL